MKVYFYKLIKGIMDGIGRNNAKAPYYIEPDDHVSRGSGDGYIATEVGDLTFEQVNGKKYVFKILNADNKNISFLER